MGITPQDPVSSDPTPRPRPRAAARPMAHPAVRLGRWLGRLAFLGDGLVMAVRMLTLARGPSRTGGADLTQGWDLVARAVGWMGALKRRLKAQRRAAGEPERAGPSLDPPEQLLRVPEYARTTALDMEIRRALRHARADAVAQIADLPTAAVFAQICTDAADAARLLGFVHVEREVDEIAVALRALLDEVGDAADAPTTTHPDAVAARTKAKVERLLAECRALLPCPAELPRPADTG